MAQVTMPKHLFPRHSLDLVVVAFNVNLLDQEKATFQPIVAHRSPCLALQLPRADEWRQALVIQIAAR